MTFRYDYSASDNREIEAIRKKYLPKAENKFEELKRLDRKVQNAGMILGLVIGILTFLIFGLGVCMAIQVIGGGIVPGVILGILGIVGMTATYPIYRMASDKAKAELIPKILKLADEIDQNNTQL